MCNKKLLLIGILLASAPLTWAESSRLADSLPGGEGSVNNHTMDAYSLPMTNLSRAHKKKFVMGRSLFRQNWVAAPSSVPSVQGLGPTFNTVSCVACHKGDGRGRPPYDAKEEAVSILLRLSVPGKTPHGAPQPVPHYGDQLNNHGITGVPAEGTFSVSFEDVHGQYPDGEKFTLTQPTYKISDLAFGELPKDVMVSPRAAPPIFGLGLLEMIPEQDLLKNTRSKPDENGIQGKANYVWDVTKKKKMIGRFGVKANQPSVMQQNAGALLGDMGITSPLFPDQNCPPEQKECVKAFRPEKPEVSAKDLDFLTSYVRTLAVPTARKLTESEIVLGRQLMDKALCTQCHIPSFKTGVDKEFPELSNQTIFPYTDLLLHDMGEELADHRPDFEATGREWRTPPLWGIGLTKTVNNHTRFMHDGRARNLEEAILWHNGEAKKSKELFMSFKKQDRASLIKFVESL